MLRQRASGVRVETGCALVVGGVALALCACGPSRVQTVDAPGAALKDQQISYTDPERQALVDRVWQEGANLPSEQRREALKSIAWQAGQGAPARVRAIDLLASDPADAGQADTRAMLALLLPVEADYAVARHVSQLAAQNGWRELVPALVRSLARQRSVIPDAQRAEAAAIERLTGQSLERACFELFAQEPAGDGRARERAEKARSSAWEVLGRLDPDGTKRAAMIREGGAGPGGAGGAGGAHGELAEAARAIGAVPITGEQLAWLRQMRGASAWWAQATGAVARVPAEGREGLGLRHAEVVRWAAQHEPSWLELSRERLAEMGARAFNARARHERQPDGLGDLGVGSERFSDALSKLRWADILTLLVVDRALRDARVTADLWAQSQRDRADTSTEYGGVLDVSGDAPAARLFVPRGSQRLGDERFVASQELVDASATGLAHYHFHAQRVENARYAGPSPGDAEYAARTGRTCVVLTPVREGVLNADVLLPTGVTVDIGELRAVARP